MDSNTLTVKKGGRPRGHPNKATANTRKAIAEFIDYGSTRFLVWLEQVASGIPRVDEQGKVLRDLDGAVQWVNRPDPAQAFKLVESVIQYHVPKLASMDLAAVVTQSPIIEVLDAKAGKMLELSDSQFEAMLASGRRILDAELVSEPRHDDPGKPENHSTETREIPEWMK
jgi:hypothetical protein